jgi:hypothetical protein
MNRKNDFIRAFKTALFSTDLRAGERIARDLIDAMPLSKPSDNDRIAAGDLLMQVREELRYFEGLSPQGQAIHGSISSQLKAAAKWIDSKRM